VSTIWLPFVAYLALHLAGYFVLRASSLRREKGILAYHLASFVGVTGVACLLALHVADDQPWASAFAVISLHGIYSLSFLEAWSLAQGSYSLSILAAVHREARTGSRPDFSRLEEIGVAKQRGRLDTLERLHLIERRQGWLRLTVAGRRVAATLSALRTWSSPTRS